MTCVDCVRDDKEIREGDHVLAEFVNFDSSVINGTWTGGLWHAECARRGKPSIVSPAEIAELQ